MLGDNETGQTRQAAHKTKQRLRWFVPKCEGLFTDVSDQNLVNTPNHSGWAAPRALVDLPGRATADITRNLLVAAG